MNKNITGKYVEKINPGNLWLVMGGNPSNTDTTTFTAEDAFAMAKIPENQTSLITKMITWESDKIFYPWKPNLNSEQYPYYCFYQNVVYLCLSNNNNNRKDQYGFNLTSVPPNSTTTFPSMGADGYTWLPLWKLDYTKEQFLTDTNLPIPTFTVSQPSNTFSDYYNNICSDGITGSGVCCLYYKENTTDKITGITHNAGDLVDLSISCECYQCDDISKALNYTSVFLSGATYSYCNPSISVLSLKEFLENNSNSIAPNTTNAFQLQLLQDYSAHENGVMRVELDLTDLSEDDLYVNTANPYLTVVDPHTTNLAVVRLKTNQISDTKHEVYGIQLIDTGKNHIFPSFSIANNTSSVLNDRIDLITYPNNIFTDPSLLLPSNFYMINAFINVGELQNTVDNVNYKKISLINNPKTIQNNSLKQYAPNETAIKRLETKIKVEVTDDGSEAGVEQGVAALINPNEGNLPPYGFDLSVQQPTAGNNNTGYQFYYSSIRTGDLLANKNYGRIYRNGMLVPGYHIEVSDFTDDAVAPVAVGDSIKILGNTCEVFEVTTPEFSKQDNEYFSVNNIDLNIGSMNPSINLAFSLKVNT